MALSDLLQEARPGVVIVGAGAVGTALGVELARQGYPVLGVFSRTLASAKALAMRVGAPIYSTDFADLPGNARLLFCCVPDDAVAVVARELAALRHPWRGTLVAHTSGALPASELEPVGRLGAALLSFHPIQTFAHGASASFEGITIGLEGQERAVMAGVQIATSLQAAYVVVPAEAKTRYHLAAVVASNFLVTLLGLVNEILGSIEIDQKTGVAMMQPLIASTLQNVARLGPEEALTGPIVRGDSITVSHHSTSLGEHLPHLLPVYTALAAETVRLAVRSSRLAPEQAEMMLDALHAYLTAIPPAMTTPPPASEQPARLAAGAEGRRLRKVEIAPPWERL